MFTVQTHKQNGFQPEDPPQSLSSAQSGLCRSHSGIPDFVVEVFFF
jgi:hypothetical protein